jgi:iron complex outermembrane receptor protein
VDNDQRYIDTKANIAVGTWGDLELGASYNNRTFDSDLFFFGSPFNTRRDTETSGVHAKLIVDKKIADFRNLLVTGVDYYYSTVTNRTTFFGSSTYSDISKNETGLYIQDEFFITDKISLSLGYRYADTRFDDTVSGFTSVSDEQKFTEEAYRTGATFNYANGSKVFVNYAKGYRLPTTDELFDFTGAITNLKPEKSDTYEAGIVHAFGKRLQAHLTLYIMDVRDELFFNPIGGQLGFGTNENLDKTRHTGVETGFTAVVTDAVSVFGNFTYTDVKFKSGPFDGNRIQLVPQYSASLGGDYRFLQSFLLAANVNWIGEKYLDNDVQNDFDKMESYIVVNAKLSYTYKGLTAYIGVNNIFDEEYSEYCIVGSFGTKNFYPAPERNFYGGLRVAL